MFRTTLALLKRETQTASLFASPTPQVLLATFEAMLSEEADRAGVPRDSFSTIAVVEAMRNNQRDCIATTIRTAILASTPESLLTPPVFPKDEKTGKRPGFNTSARHQYDITVAGDTYKVNKMQGRPVYKLTRKDGQVLYVNCTPLF